MFARRTENIRRQFRRKTCKWQAVSIRLAPGGRWSPWSPTLPRSCRRHCNVNAYLHAANAARAHRLLHDCCWSCSVYLTWALRVHWSVDVERRYYCEIIYLVNYSEWFLSFWSVCCWLSCYIIVLCASLANQLFTCLASSFQQLRILCTYLFQMDYIPTQVSIIYILGTKVYFFTYSASK